jgi:hypothetical protein
MDDFENGVQVPCDWNHYGGWPEISQDDLEKFDELFSKEGCISQYVFQEILQSVGGHSAPSNEVSNLTPDLNVF